MNGNANLLSLGNNSWGGIKKALEQPACTSPLPIASDHRSKVQDPEVAANSFSFLALITAGGF